MYVIYPCSHACTFIISCNLDSKYTLARSTVKYRKTAYIRLTSTTYTFIDFKRYSVMSCNVAIHHGLYIAYSNQQNYCGDVGIEFLGKGSYCDLMSENKKSIHLLL